MECPVCYETACLGDRKILECSHSLCVSCFKRLIKSVCPLCRASINIADRESLDMFRTPLWSIIAGGRKKKTNTI
jgi:hypothetical protein